MRGRVNGHTFLSVCHCLALFQCKTQPCLSVPRVQAPNEEKFYEAIARLGTGGAPDELRQLRILAWHKRNDAYREDTNIAAELSLPARKNMQDLSIEIQDIGKTGGQLSLGDGIDDS